MPVEDHPLWPKFKEALEHLIATKTKYEEEKRKHGENSVPARNAKSDYGFALHAYYMIADKV